MSALASVWLEVNASTAVGAQVDNQAFVSYESSPSGVVKEEESEVETFVVQELTDFSLVYLGETPQPVASPSQQTVLAYTLSHLGNGQEQYALLFENQAASENGDQFDALTPQIYIDDGDGVFDESLDSVYDPTQPLELGPDAIQHLFVTVAVPIGLAIGDTANTSLTATALSPGENVGQPGYFEEGAGDDGHDLVVGSSGGQQTVQLPLVVVNNASLELTKTVANIADPHGGERPLPDAVITYQIDVTYFGEGLLTGIVIADAIPNDTHYLPGSLSLDGLPQTDGNDADSAEYDSQNNQVIFDLGDIDVPHAVQIIQFQVTIQ